MQGHDSDHGQPVPPADILQSWKEIAAYLDATERSAQRWEQLEGLPVHRQIRNKRSAVYAYKSEIEEWRRSRSTPPAAAPPEEEANARREDRASGRPRRPPSWMLAAGAVCAVALIAYWASNRPAPPPRIEAVEQLTKISGEVASPAISPDGSKVAFAWRAPGRKAFDIALIEPGADEPRRVGVGKGNESGPAWSPDGKQLAFCRVPSGGTVRLADLVVMDADGENERVVTRVALPPRFTPWSFGHYLTWTPDGAALIGPPPERGAGSGLIRIDLAGGETEVLTNPGPGAFDTAPAVSPDGTRMAFLRSSTPIHSDVYVVDLTSAERIPERLTMDGGWAGAPAFLGDGEFLLATAGRLAGARQLFALDPSGKQPPAALGGAPGDIYGLAISRDGARAVALHGKLEVDLYRADLTGTEPRIEKLLDRSGVQGLPALSPDGTMLAFESFGGDSPEGLWVLDLQTNQARPLTDQVGMLGGPASWSPDGRKLAMAAADPEGQHLYVVEVDDGAVAQITSGSERAFPPRWTSDGNALMAAIGGPDGSPHAFRLAFPSGEIQRQSETGAVMVADMQGGGYVLVNSERDLLLQRRGEQETIANLYWRHTFEVQKGQIVFLRHNGRSAAPTAEVYSRKMRQTRVLAELPGAWRGFTVSPDRSTIYFDREESDTTGLQWFTLAR